MNQVKKELTPEEVQQYKAASELEETDYLKLSLLNRNVDLFTSQAELSQLKMIEASRALMGFSNELAERYDFHDARQVDARTGKIERDLSKLGIGLGGGNEPSR